MPSTQDILNAIGALIVGSSDAHSTQAQATTPVQADTQTTTSQQPVVEGNPQNSGVSVVPASGVSVSGASEIDALKAKIAELESQATAATAAAAATATVTAAPVAINQPSAESVMGARVPAALYTVEGGFAEGVTDSQKLEFYRDVKNKETLDRALMSAFTERRY